VTVWPSDNDVSLIKLLSLSTASIEIGNHLKKYCRGTVLRPTQPPTSVGREMSASQGAVRKFIHTAQKQRSLGSGTSNAEIRFQFTVKTVNPVDGLVWTDRSTFATGSSECTMTKKWTYADNSALKIVWSSELAITCDGYVLTIVWQIPCCQWQCAVAGKATVGLVSHCQCWWPQQGRWGVWHPSTLPCYYFNSTPINGQYTTFRMVQCVSSSDSKTVSGQASTDQQVDHSVLQAYPGACSNTAEWSGTDAPLYPQAQRHHHNVLLLPNKMPSPQRTTVITHNTTTKMYS